MDEIFTQLPSSHIRQKHRSLPFLRLIGTFLFACLMLSYFGAPARATSQTAPSSVFSIHQGATPGGWSTVHYSNVTLAVPAAWPVYDLSVHPERCTLFNTHAVYLGQQGANAQCSAHAIGKSEALQIETLATAPLATTRLASTAATIAGVAAKVNASNSVSHTFVIVLSQAGVVIRLSYGKTSNLAKQILGTLQVSGKQSSTSTQAMVHTSLVVNAASQILGVFQGQGFDACTAPSTGAMSAWLNSSYRAVGIYIGGANRACGDGNLSASWVNAVTGNWNLMSFYVGLQAPCNAGLGFATIDPNQAFAQGTQGADDAVNSAQGFGLGTESLLINDMENYDNSNASCSQAVMTFLNGWTQELHTKGYLSGVYSNLGSGISDLINDAGSISEPDTIDFAKWDGVATTSDPGVPSGDWANHQRMKQFVGDHNETYGGVTINIDTDQLDTTLYKGSGGGGSGIPAAPGATARV